MAVYLKNKMLSLVIYAGYESNYIAEEIHNRVSGLNPFHTGSASLGRSRCVLKNAQRRDARSGVSCSAVTTQ